MDDVVYVVPEASSSFSIVTQQFMIANGINTSQVIAWDGQGAVPNGIDLNGKAVVILDDIVGSGKSMLSQNFKFWGENSDSGNAIVVDTSTNQPLFAKQYENVPVIVAPLSTLKQGETNILEAFRSTGHEGTVIAGTTVDVSAELVNDTFLQMAIGNTGYENGYAATFTPYMFPDNNTALASLFNYMSILNPNTSSIKSSGGVGEYLKLFYGKHISNPSPNSLCGKILAKMKENATRKK